MRDIIGLFLSLLLLFMSPWIQADCVSSIAESTPDSQLIDHGNGTISHSSTGLMWRKCSEGQTNDGSCTGTASSFTWEAALQAAKSLNNSGGFAGFTDWRIPNVKELQSIVELSCFSPAINSVKFPNTQSSHYWSASGKANNFHSAWSVQFGNGDSTSAGRSWDLYVRLVRGGQ